MNCFDADDITTPFGGYKSPGFGREGVDDVLFLERGEGLLAALQNGIGHGGRAAQVDVMFSEVAEQAAQRCGGEGIRVAAAAMPGEVVDRCVALPGLLAHTWRTS